MFSENFRIALSSLRRNKLRSFLTVIGVIIGVMTVMVVSAIISGIKVNVEKQIKTMGTDSITITKRGMTERGRKSQEERMRKPLTLADADEIRTLAMVKASVPSLDISFNKEGENTKVIGKNGKTSSFTSIKGAHPSISEANTETLIEGRWFTEGENNFKKDVALISSVVALDYFPNKSAIGESLAIGRREFRIVGVLEKRDQSLGGANANRKIYVPINSALRINPDAEHLVILAVAKSGKMLAAQQQIEDLLRIRRQVAFGKENNFGLRTADSMIKKFNSITAGVFVAMVVISSIGLMIGGIGVMNIMLVSVRERTSEIGIRKTVGARSKDILVQFLVESTTMTGIGGLLGIGIGWLVAVAISVVFPSYVPFWAPIASVLVSVGIGVIFGVFPAWKAARLDPIEALRYE